MTAERDGVERELIAGTDLAAIAGFRSEMAGELDAARRNSAIASRSRTTKNRLTRGTVSETVTNIESIRKRLEAIGEAFRIADALKLEPDQSELPDRFAEIRAALPAIDNNPDFPENAS